MKELLDQISPSDAALADDLAKFQYDPLGYVRYAYPWKEAGTRLEGFPGPCPCQVKALKLVGAAVLKNRFDGVRAVPPVRLAISSGHGIGKTGLAAFIVDWILSTRPFAMGTITANTFSQLQNKTWAGLKSWTGLAINGHWYESTTQRLYKLGARESWFAAAQAAKEENSEAFAGQHAKTSTSFYVFDEASAIPDAIFDVAEGGLSDGEPMIFLFGNPTRNQGKFYRVAFGSERHRWMVLNIDSRDCPLTNKDLIKEWAEDYGEESDFFRVRVLGLAPTAADLQFIDGARIYEAQKRKPVVLKDDALVAGCDLAWGGEDMNCIRFRRGMDARSIAPIKIPGERTRDANVMIGVLANALTKEYGPDKKKIDMLFLDSAGICGAIVPRLRQMGHKNIVEVNFGADSPDQKYENMRSYMWGQLKEWLPQGCIDTSADLEEDLMGPGFRMSRRMRIVLEEKEKLRKRVGHSSDDADALGLTFAMPVTTFKKKWEDPMARAYAGGGGAYS